MMIRTELHTPLPDRLDSSRAKLVYLYLAHTGEGSVTELQQALGLSKLALFSILDSLTAKELVHQTERGYACR